MEMSRVALTAIEVRLPPELLGILESEAKAMGLSRSVLITRLLRQALKPVLPLEAAPRPPLLLPEIRTLQGMVAHLQTQIETLAQSSQVPKPLPIWQQSEAVLQRLGIKGYPRLLRFPRPEESLPECLAIRLVDIPTTVNVTWMRIITHEGEPAILLADLLETDI